MPGDEHNPYRFSSGPIVKVAAGLVIASVIALVVTVIVTGGNGFAVGLLIALAATTAVGLALERIDTSRNREHGSSGSRDDHWGYHGRPGA